MLKIRWMWILLALLLSVKTGVLGKAPGYRNPHLLIETAELASILGNPEVRFLDVRTPEEYRLGHLPGAVNLPAPATDSLESNRQGLPLDTERAQQLFRGAGVNASSHVILYDDQGNRFAARVFYVLEFFGHPRVRVLNGGFKKWQSEGRPTTTEQAEVGAGDFKPVPNSAVLATSEWLAERLNDPTVKLVDARSPAEYRGEKVLGPRGGHIPGAVNIEWTRAIQSGDIKTFLDATELEQLFAESQVTRGQEVVTYCQMGMRSSQLYFVLRLLGFEKIRNYDGSWADWSTNLALPVDK